jgi:hypothetical protein
MLDIMYHLTYHSTWGEICHHLHEDALIDGWSGVSSPA